MLYPRAWAAIRVRVWGVVISDVIYPCPGTAHLVEPRCLGGVPETDHLPEAENTEERSDMLPVKILKSQCPNMFIFTTESDFREYFSAWRPSRKEPAESL